MGKTLKIVTYNSNSVMKQKQELNDFVAIHKPDIMLIQETWLKQRYRFTIPNYNIYRTDRETRGGGTAVLVKRQIKHNEIQRRFSQGIEGTGVRIYTPDEVDIWSIYIPPSKQVYLDDIRDMLKHERKFLIGGDLNAKHQSWGARCNNTKGEILQKIINNSLEIEVLAPGEPTHVDTRGSKDILDIGLTDLNVHINTKVLGPINSDHSPVEFLIKMGYQEQHETIPRRKHEYDWEIFKKKADELCRKPSTPARNQKEIDDEALYIEKSIKRALSTAEIETGIRIRKGSKPKPLPANIKENIRKRNGLRRSYKETKFQPMKAEINKLDKIIKEQITRYRNEEWNNFIQRVIETDEKTSVGIHRIPKILKKAANGSNKIGCFISNNKQVVNDKEKAEVLAATYEKQFTANRIGEEAEDLITRKNNSIQTIAPDVTTMQIAQEVKEAIKKLKDRKAAGIDDIPNFAYKKLGKTAIWRMAKLYKTCFQLAIFPESYKISKVIPILKHKKAKNDPQSYRPINLLKTSSKILERLITDRINDHLTENDTLINEQAGFRPAHSTAMQLARIITDIDGKIDNRETVAGLFVDINKAFDQVDHRALIYKLRINRVPDYLIEIVQDFLKNRKFMVKVEQEYSTIKAVGAGVPQGSILGPTLFILFINDIPKEIPHTELSIFADDTAIFATAHRTPTAVKRLQAATDKIMKYLNNWGLIVNEAKTQLVVFTRNKKRPKKEEDTININGKRIGEVKETKYLGVMLDNKLSIRKETKYARDKARGAFKTLAPILLNPTIKSDTAIQLYKTYIRPHLTYSSPAWNYTNHDRIEDLRKCETRMMRTIYTKHFEEEGTLYTRKTNKQIYEKLKLECITDHLWDAAYNMKNKMENHINPLYRETIDKMQQ